MFHGSYIMYTQKVKDVIHVVARENMLSSENENNDQKGPPPKKKFDGLS